jgi:hypothetical protein
MADYSDMKPYLRYFTFSPNFEKPIKAVIRHRPPDLLAEDISNIPEDSSFKVINVRQMMATRKAPHGQGHVETLALFLVTLTRNIKP